MLAAADLPITAIDPLLPEERDDARRREQSPGTSQPDLTINELLRRQAAAFPEVVAVRHGAEQLTYGSCWTGPKPSPRRCVRGIRAPGR